MLRDSVQQVLYLHDLLMLFMQISLLLYLHSFLSVDHFSLMHLLVNSADEVK